MGVFLSPFRLKAFDYFNRTVKRIIKADFVPVNLAATRILNEKLRAVFGLEDCDQKTIDCQLLHFLCPFRLISHF